MDGKSVLTSTLTGTNASSVRPSSPYEEPVFRLPPPLKSSTICAPDKGAHWPPSPHQQPRCRAANEFQQVSTKLGRNQLECNLPGPQTCLHCQLISQPTGCPFLRPQLMTSLFVQHPPPPPPPHRHLIWTGHFYMWWHTSWQNGEGCKKSHSCATFCPVINSPDFFLPNL